VNDIYFAECGEPSPEANTQFNYKAPKHKFIYFLIMRNGEMFCFSLACACHIGLLLPKSHEPTLAFTLDLDTSPADPWNMKTVVRLRGIDLVWSTKCGSSKLPRLTGNWHVYFAIQPWPEQETDLEDHVITFVLFHYLISCARSDHPLLCR
jgi:hypothetical protein